MKTNFRVSLPIETPYDLLVGGACRDRINGIYPRPNDYDLYFINTMDVEETRIYDASTFRLRNVSLTYNFPKKHLQRTPFGSISFTALGDNLWYYAPNMPKHLNIDPEVLSSNVGNAKGIDLQNEPSYKIYSFNVKLTF